MKEGGNETVTKCHGLNMLAETATTEISQKREPKNMDENKKAAREGGNVAGNARKDIERKTGRKVITNRNAKQLGQRNSRRLS